MAKLSALPDSWVERIFSVMSAAYGTMFSDRWRGINLDEVRSLWAEELATFSDCPDCFRKALKAMTDECKYPPTLPEFRALCRRNYVAPRSGFAEIQAPQTLSPEEAKARVERVAESAIQKPKLYDYRGWAMELRRRYMAGETLLPIQISMASEALGEVWANRECRSVEVSA